MEKNHHQHQPTIHCRKQSSIITHHAMWKSSSSSTHRRNQSSIITHHAMWKSSSSSTHRRNQSSVITHHAMWKSSSSSKSYSSTASSAKKSNHVPVKQQQPFFVMKRSMDMKKIEKLYDCFLLDFNPDEYRTAHARNKVHSSGYRGDNDIHTTTHVRNKLHSSGYRGENDIRRTTHARDNLQSSGSRGDTDICITAEKGKVALRDYPHPRHLCTRYPFKKTPHHKHCRLCYCYVCDVVAPCKHWLFHCGATNLDPQWKL